MLLEGLTMSDEIETLKTRIKQLEDENDRLRTENDILYDRSVEETMKERNNNDNTVIPSRVISKDL